MRVNDNVVASCELWIPAIVPPGTPGVIRKILRMQDEAKEFAVVDFHDYGLGDVYLEDLTVAVEA
jgi:hypothetical protein